MANFIQMMQKAAGLKSKMKDLQDRFAMSETAGASEDGRVRARVNGKFDLIALEIDPSVIDPASPETLESLVMTAVNDASGRARDAMAAETRKVMEDLGLPPGFDLPV